ncbi:cytochrome c oxidase subunit 3 [Maritimibacter dapengensis]|uniref:Cytochrome c oxidase subunit 3 n=1 Tax=Maritimibacter dapengensis TaxID=2836868 RepID=A0ABS6T0Y4_9RHOB|nr:cytochrome c oxidase subunit 3 [Maritimibacter dapengensis]MBV7378904.1 cytochrome c oxidase subunit 3 [Maritimibacter dapengensis]
MSETRVTAIDALPGEFMMWVLIMSELAVFGAGLIVFSAVRLTDLSGFADAQAQLHTVGAGVNTVVLVTSGWLAARAVGLAEKGRVRATRVSLGGAAALGVVFLWIKGAEYADKAAAGINFETHSFFTFYYLLTGFHAAHVIAGLVIFALVAWKCQPRLVETGAQFWHMVDLVWLLLFPVLYLVGRV